jgi:hypothetical protein
MIARLFHAPLDKPDEEALGVSTVGSSEAIILATLAMKKKFVLLLPASSCFLHLPYIRGKMGVYRFERSR